MALPVSVKDFVSLLEQIPIWKRLSALPTRMDELERRLAALEQKPKLPICEKCGIGYMRLDRNDKLTGPFAVFEGAGSHIKVYKCDNCGSEERKSV